jgi:hypothetical protein
VADIDKIVSGSPAAPAAAVKPVVQERKAAPPVLNSPSVEFGGSNGPFPAQPYVAPSR